MDLRSRLAQLESKLGLGARERQSLPVVDGQAAVSVAARLQRLAAQGDASRRKAISPEAIAVLLRGELCADGVVLIEQRLPASQAHGRVAFSSLRDVPLTFLAGGEEPCREGLLFIDTETTGLAGGTGTVAFVLGLSRMEGAFVRVRQYFLLRFGAEAAMLAHALDWIRGATHLVSFNGKSFDVPLWSRAIDSLVSKPIYRSCHTSTCSIAHAQRSAEIGPTVACRPRNSICSSSIATTTRPDI